MVVGPHVGGSVCLSELVLVQWTTQTSAYALRKTSSVHFSGFTVVTAFLSETRAEGNDVQFPPCQSPLEVMMPHVAELPDSLCVAAPRLG